MPSYLQSNAQAMPQRAPVQLPPGVPQPGPAMGTPPLGPAMGAPAAGLAGLAPSGYRGPNPVTSIGRGATDFSGFPGAMNGVSPLMSAPSGMPMGMGQPPMGMPGMPQGMLPQGMMPTQGMPMQAAPPMGMRPGQGYGGGY